MKNIMLCLVLGCALSVFAQEFPIKKTKDHQQIKGTNVFLVPPASFEPSTMYKGFVKQQDASKIIMYMQIPGPFNEVVKGFDPIRMEAQGMTLLHSKKHKIAGLDALTLEVAQKANGIDFLKYILVYGNKNSSSMLNGIYTKEDKVVGDAIKSAIHTTYIDTSLDVDPRKALSFTINEEIGNMKFHSVVGNGMLLNRDQEIPTKSPDKLSLIMDKSFAKGTVANLQLFSKRRMEQYPDAYIINDSKSEAVQLDGLEGYRLEATKQMDPKESILQLILLDQSGGYYIFLGTYNNNFPQARKDILAVIQTFKQRK
ncbi:MAG: hypothetical protein OIF50_06765 [Flavobacteriaceae bacterium]|nr:hypothetical protein [Flavobacteriaceae bacterium]